MSKPVLGYWDIRGFAQQIRHFLAYLGVDYEDKLYGFGDGPEPNADAWFSVKFTLGLDFPNVPYWIDDKVKLSESKAIMRYLARTRGPATIPDTLEEQAVADSIEGVAADLQRTLCNLCYSASGKPEKEPLEVSLAPKFEQLQKFFENRQFIGGDKITYVDFYLYEVLFEFERYNSEFLKPYPALDAYMRRFEALPQLAEVVKSSANLKCYSPYATNEL